MALLQHRLLLFGFLLFVTAIPPPPTGLTALFGDSQATLSWIAPVTSESITQYAVCVTTVDNTSTTCQRLTGSPPPTSLLKTGLLNLQSYTFTVNATSIFGTGPYSDPSAPFTPRPLVTWTAAHSNLWSDPTNWSPARVPLDSDVISLPNKALIALDVSGMVFGIQISGTANIQCISTNITTGYVSKGTLSLSGSGGCYFDIHSDGTLGTTMSGVLSWNIGWNIVSSNLRIDSPNVLTLQGSSMKVTNIFGTGTISLTGFNINFQCGQPNQSISFGTLSLSSATASFISCSAIYISVINLAASQLVVDCPMRVSTTSVTTGSTIYISTKLILDLIRISNSGVILTITGSSASSEVIITKTVNTEDVGCGCSAGCCNCCYSPNGVSLIGNGTLLFGAVGLTLSDGVDLTVANQVIWLGGGGGVHLLTVDSGWSVINTINNTWIVREQYSYAAGQLQISGTGFVLNNGNISLIPDSTYTSTTLLVSTLSNQTTVGSLYIHQVGQMTFNNPKIFTQYLSGSLFLNGSIIVGVGFSIDPALAVTGSGTLYCGSNSLKANMILPGYASTCVGPPPSSCSYPSSFLNCTIGTSISAIKPTCANNPQLFAIDPQLPDGLLFNTANGQISGTPSVNSSVGSSLYKVVATNAGGSSLPFNVTIQINPYACPPCYYCPDPTIQIPCPSGYYCPGNTITPIPCPPNSLCPPSSKTFTCITNFTGPSCEQCVTGHYGANCAPCPSANGKTCNSVGTCDGDGTTSGSGICSCPQNWSGDACELCVKDHYGTNCTACPSANGITCNGVGTCDGDGTTSGSGNCSCPPDWCGDACERCVAGHYGTNCTACPSANGKACNGVGVCDGDGTTYGSGNCSCPSGWSGNACETCEGTLNPNWLPDCSGCSKNCFGPTCEFRCNCQSDCSDGFNGTGSCTCMDSSQNLSCEGQCNSTNGVCTCVAAGAYGDYCQYSGLVQARIAGGIMGTLFPLLALVVFVFCHVRLSHLNAYWETKTLNSALSWTNRSNLAYVISLIVDVITTCAFAFQRSIPWHTSLEPVQTGIEGTILILGQRVFFATLLACTILSVVYIVFLFPFFFREGKYVADCLNSRKLIGLLLMPAPIIAFLCSLGFNSIMNTFFRGLACTYTSVAIPPYLDADPSISCWTDPHQNYVLLSCFGIIFFFPAILYTAPQYDLKQNVEQEIFVKPTFRIQQMIASVVMAMISTFFTSYPVIIVATTASVTFVLGIVSLKGIQVHPLKINVARSLGYFFCFWCACCGMIAAAIDNRSSYLPVSILLGGFLLTLITYIGVIAGFIDSPWIALERMATSLGVPLLEKN